MNLGFVLLIGVGAVVLGRKKPLIGIVTGCVLTLILYFVSQDFQLKSFIIHSLIGLAISCVSSFLGNIIISGHKGGNHNTGPGFIGSGRHGGGGNIVHTDEEIKNQKP
ncbi:MAG: hypothetical protein HOD85_20625 [Deltaproteobacteria bacterium]|jgi:hypothetical protein|nr:hypothetical protein [Deltaproteobacteria bacterium]